VLGQLRQELLAARKARDPVAVAALGSAIGAIENAEAVDVSSGLPALTSSEHVAGATAGVGSSDVERRVLSEADVVGIVRGQVDERISAADQYEQLGERERAERLRLEAAVLRRHLP